VTARDLLTQWTPGAPITTLVAAAAAYAIGVRRARRWPALRTVAYFSGLVVLAVALLSGIDTWADRLQSVHMVQHTLLLLVAPLLLCAGAPATLALRTLRWRHGLAAVLRRVPAHPAVGLPVLAATMLVVHLTSLYEARGVLHEAEHVWLVAAGLLFWTPLVGADPGPRIGAGGRVGISLAAMAPMGALSAVLLTATPRSAQYAASAQAAGVDPAADQHAAAIVMWVGGGLVISVAVLVLTGVALWQEEARMRRREAVGAP
jgi:putative copper resistance protein D